MNLVIRKKIEECCNYILKLGTKEQSDVILGLCNWMYENVRYGMNGNADQVIWSVFGMGKSVCMGISKAAAVILKEFCIESIVTHGWLMGNNPHAWLIVLVDGKYSHVDITTGYSCFDEIWYRYGKTEKRFCILQNNKWIQDTHTLDNSYYYPECGGDL